MWKGDYKHSVDLTEVVRVYASNDVIYHSVRGGQERDTPNSWMRNTSKHVWEAKQASSSNVQYPSNVLCVNALQV